ncbi:Bug family tripartite tricarboxylate transporter substrate binding protein [Aureimonas fodinaquatilis]|uniref:Bug family tripartite tricarboxylate transporter substrate binding protein n=1 Tax=Aureimonas fodinaquatilis TaxID=2565783 RepID=UPI00165D3DF4|nr:tripartite tricarboxylate transporter substrate binding protein [Aureimonas fodinaquatilis]
MSLFSVIRTACVAAALLAGVSAAHAQDFPDRAITSIVAFGAGGSTDVAARSLVRFANEYIGQEIAVENRTGGAGAVGMLALANARPDGYTIGTVNFELLTFRPLERAPVGPDDVRFIMKVQSSPATLTVQADAPWNTLEEFIEDARKRPNELRIAASPPGAVWNVAAGLITSETNTEINVVPFDGGAQSAIALLGGQVDATTISVQEVIDHVTTGKLKVLATATEERHPALPDVPTFKEAGYDIVFGSWAAMAAPKDIPEERFQVLSAALKDMFDDERFQTFAAENGITLDYVAGDELAGQMEADAEKVAAILAAQGLTN